jgi:chromate transporter
VSGPGAELGWLALGYAQMSLLAVGGVSAVLPEMQRLVVQHGWMGRSEFATLFALAQMAPGPNMLVATAVGWRVAGLPGALAATFGMIGPSSLLTGLSAGAWHRFRERPWRRRIQAGLLVASTAKDVLTAGITLAVTTAVLATRVHPLALLAAGAAAGVLFGPG